MTGIIESVTCSLWSVSNLLAVLILFVVLVFAIVSNQKPSGIPPGPPLTLPIIGDIPILLHGKIQQTFKNLRHSYGDIFSFYLGRELVVVFNGQQTIRKAAAKNVFAGRPRNYLTNVVSKGRGLLLASGPLWKSQRLFIHNFLQSTPPEGRSFEETILTEANYLVKVFKDTKGEPFDPSDVIYASFANINLSMVVGNRREYNDAVFVKLRQILTEATILHLRLSVLLNCIPFLKHFPMDLLGLQKIQGWTDFIGQFATNMYNDHKLRHRDCDLKGSCPRRDMMDLFICEINRAARKNQPTDFTLDQLKVLIGELLGAASESPTTFLRWAILYLLHFPDIKDRIIKDIKHVLGKRQPKFEDISGLPYVEAFICEVLRISNVVPFAMPHACCGDFDVQWEGFTIPKDCTILFNLDSVLKDPNLFNNPESFDPDRFLDSSGNIVKTKGFIPFGTGRRICPGENISWIEMFLFTTVLIQEFDFLPKETDNLPKLEGIVSLGYSPRPFEIRVVSKHS